MCVCLAANGIIDAAQTTSTLGTALLGYSSKLKDVNQFVNKVGKSCDSLSGVAKKISGPIEKASSELGRYSKIVDNFSKCENLSQMSEMVARARNGADLSISKMPKVTDVLNQSLV